MSVEPVVELVGVARNYRRGDEEVHALEDFSLEIGAGQFTGFGIKAELTADKPQRSGDSRLNIGSDGSRCLISLDGFQYHAFLLFCRRYACSRRAVIGLVR